MYAILNFFDDPKLSAAIKVVVGSKVKASLQGEAFNLTPDKEYEVLEINNLAAISVINDLGILDMYTVECFKV